MHKQAFITYLAKKHRRPQRHYQEAIDEILQGIADQLKQGKKLSFLGFGTFYTRQHKGGTGINFKTKQPLTYKEYKQAAFRPGTLLRQAIRRKKGLFSR